MRRYACLAFALALLAALARAGAAQPYGGVTPMPRTTDPATMHAQAAQREAIERIRIGLRDEMQGAWTQAAAEFERVVAIAPAEPQLSTAYYDLGIARHGLGDNAAAASAFSSAIDRDPGFLAARANLVTVLLEAGNNAGARAAADAFVAYAPGSARALYGRGITALRGGDAATALHDFRALIGSDPSYAVAHYDLALAEQALGKYDDAEREFQAAVSLSPAYARARIALGAVLLHEGKRDEARVAFDAAARDANDATLRTLAASLRDAIK